MATPNDCGMLMSGSPSHFRKQMSRFDVRANGTSSQRMRRSDREEKWTKEEAKLSSQNVVVGNNSSEICHVSILASEME